MCPVVFWNQQNGLVSLFGIYNILQQQASRHHRHFCNLEEKYLRFVLKILYFTVHPLNLFFPNEVYIEDGAFNLTAAKNPHGISSLKEIQQ